VPPALSANVYRDNIEHAETFSVMMHHWTRVRMQDVSPFATVRHPKSRHAPGGDTRHSTKFTPRRLRRHGSRSHDAAAILGHLGAIEREYPVNLRYVDVFGNFGRPVRYPCDELGEPSHG
jgi:hypothetical protein